MTGRLLIPFRPSKKPEAERQKIEPLALPPRAPLPDPMVRSAPVEIARPARKPTPNIFDFTQPCDFPGCQPLRAAYAKELEQLGAGCTNCARAAIQQKYVNAYRKLTA
jgi:hypothetical protein